MLTINGTDYTLYVFVALSAAVLFALEYFLCAKTGRWWLRGLPWLYVALILALAVVVVLTDAGNGDYIDLTAAVALLLCAYAAICAAALAAAVVAHRLTRR